MYDRKYDFQDEKEIKDLLLFRKVVKVKDHTMFLDNGTKLRVLPNVGCGGCNSGWYDLDNLATVNNAITDVIFDCDEMKDGYGDWVTVYRIYVICEGIQGQIELLKVSGTDGNGYYGTGYEIEVVLDER